MIKVRSFLIHIIRFATQLALSSVLFSGCAYFGNPINDAIELNNEKQYEQAVQQLNHVIESDASAVAKAQAFMLRGKSYINLHEYRYAYRDLQVAWKVSCDLYQNSPDYVLTPPNSTSNSSEPNPDSTPAAPFHPAHACVETIPLLIDELKPFTSDFAAIMATQDASAIIKKMFPELLKKKSQ
ncbi:hypothetical protein SAMN05660337_2911 [Maridesulfovibrio ferrireducens]|uniref:Tetratricopeptide repeat-containing protein n=1 Tax=Maridesulfovibrio ferrireducens TaxID=246191 RepID=A0A1G9JRH9_9BACT|nr:hypothetical protein [Maridesulfovibrio ferrireducens]SDL39805.1 hypothetical protein SAMN05660337_2911 [Maridesulfovibrio ferrireducens]